MYLSPNFADISAGAKPLAFGDLNRFHIRQVGDSFTVFRYDELYMQNYQRGWQAWLRADAQLVSADGGTSDFPIVTMEMHA